MDYKFRALCTPSRSEYGSYFTALHNSHNLHKFPLHRSSHIRNGFHCWATQQHLCDKSLNCNFLDLTFGRILVSNKKLTKSVVF